MLFLGDALQECFAVWHCCVQLLQGEECFTAVLVFCRFSQLSFPDEFSWLRFFHICGSWRSCVGLTSGCPRSSWSPGNRWSTCLCKDCIAAEGARAIVSVFCHWDSTHFLLLVVISLLTPGRVAGYPFSWNCATSPWVIKGLDLSPMFSHSYCRWFGSDQNTGQ